MMKTLSASKSSQLSPGRFRPNSRGFLRHWLVCGPIQQPYKGPPAPDDVLRREALDPAAGQPPEDATPGEPAPNGTFWRLHDPGQNDFVEFSAFYRDITVLDHFAYAEILSPRTETWNARFWSAGISDLWVNDEHICRLAVTRYRNPDFRDVQLPLKAGLNRVSVRLQCVGIRDTRVLFGLSIPNSPGIMTQLPGAAGFERAAVWLDEVRGDNNLGLRANGAAPAGVKVRVDGGEELEWKEGTASFLFPKLKTLLAHVGTAEGPSRVFDFPANRIPPGAPTGPRREAQLAFIAKAGDPGEFPSHWNAVILPLFARRLLGKESSRDAADFAAAISFVDSRMDCADFLLAALLRMKLLGLTNTEETAEIERAALGFRYWLDEPGNDAMCFQSENHTLLFHGCQLLAGLMYPNKKFSNSGRLGKEQVTIAVPRIWEWLERIEARGFEEFNSGTYMPITIGAMLNIIDFGQDSALSSRMAAQLDRIYSDLASHSFAGGVISPQGRVYRDVLFPEESGAQILLALATDATDVMLEGSRPQRERTGDWAVFPASSTTYSPPETLANLVRQPVTKTYHHADFEIVLLKTSDFVLTSLSVPAPPSQDESLFRALKPGGAGYQQHLWQATLGYDCHIFVNHPGGTFDGTLSRPGYWHGSGVLPRVVQHGATLQIIHVLPDGSHTQPEITEQIWNWGNPSTIRPYNIHPIPFIHAHWPADAFDEEKRDGHWVFGRKGKGLIGLWCSETLTPHDDRLTGRELRANTSSSAWLVLCGSLADHGTLETFSRFCFAKNPRFDHETYVLQVEGEPEVKWWERTEPMPS